MALSMERLSAHKKALSTRQSTTNLRGASRVVRVHAVARVSSKSRSRGDVSAHVLSVSPAATLNIMPEIDDTIMAARTEAAKKLATNRKAFMKDILDNSGLTRYRGSPYGRTVVSPNGYDGEVNPVIRDAVDWHLQRIGNFLQTGQVGSPAVTAEEREVGAATLAYFRASLKSHKGLSPAIAEQLRGACDEVYRHLY